MGNFPTKVYFKLTIKQLSLYQFKNYEDEKIVFHPLLNALTGLNGMGKTNILDAIYYLCLGKSFFTSSDKLVVTHDKDAFRLEAVILNGQHKDIISIKSIAGKNKEIIISGKKTNRISDHVGKFPCVMIAPSDIQYLLAGSEERRNFINNTIVQYDPVYLDHLLVYNRLLKQRNALLKNMAERRQYDPILLESVTSGMITPASYIYNARKLLEEKISDIFSGIYSSIADSREHCMIRYESQLATDKFQNLQYISQEKDRITGRTSQGIHKDDLLFFMNEHPLKDFASQGQLKSFVLALKLTQYTILESIKKVKPVLLLDDIFDKLDPQRVTHLLHLVLNKDFGQVFISDTQADRIQSILNQLGADHYIFHVENGKTTACEHSETIQKPVLN
jgi:DNA replication and repair protein RecF